MSMLIISILSFGQISQTNTAIQNFQSQIKPYTTAPENLYINQPKSQNKKNNVNTSVSYYHYENMEIVGTTLTLVGVGGMIIGAFIYSNGLNDIRNTNIHSNNFYNELNNNTSKALTGGIIMVTSEILFDVGLPLWIVGGINSNKFESKIGLVNFKSPNLYGNSSSIKGIELKIKF